MSSVNYGAPYAPKFAITVPERSSSVKFGALCAPKFTIRVAEDVESEVGGNGGAVDYPVVPEPGHTDVLEAPMTLELIRAFPERAREPARQSV